MSNKQTASTNSKTVYYWAVQGSICEFAQTYEEARSLMRKAEQAEEEEAGDNFDYCDSLQEYDYVKEVLPGGLQLDYRGRWKHDNDTYSGELPDWLLQ